MRTYDTIRSLCTGLLWMFSSSLWAQTAFEALLDEGGLSWDKPSGFEEVALRENSLLPYEMAIRSADGEMEIRYAIRPLQRIEIDYNDPHGAAPDPNHIFPLMFQALTGKLSAGGRSPSREYRQEEVKEKFNADWAAVVVFDVEPEFTRDFSSGLMLAMHRNRMADAYVVYLFNDYEAAKSRINEYLKTLYFLP